MKKIISLFLVILTIISVSVTAVYAESNVITGKCGDNATYSYDGKTETLVIEGTGKMYDYADASTVWYYTNGKKYSKEFPIPPDEFSLAKTIKISDGITHIGNNAFICYNDNLNDKNVVLEIGKDVKTIGDNAFCDILIDEIVIPDSVTTIGESAFKYSGVKKLILGSSIKYIKNNAFFNNNLSDSIIIPDSVVSIGKSAFYGCDEVTYIELGKSVKTVGEKAFLLSSFYAYNEGADYEPTVRYMIPETVTKIGKYAFGYFDVDGESQSNRWELVVVGTVGSAAYKYCEKYLVEFDDVDGCEKDTHIWGGKQCVKEKVCRKTSGTYATQCIKCGARRFEKGQNWDHDFVEETTKTVKKATYFKEGKEKTYCTTCKKYITQKTKKLSIESNVKVTAGKKKINVKYTKAKNADGFQIKYKQTGVGAKYVTKTYSTTKSATKSISKLEKGYYLVEIRVFDKTDSGKLYSDWITYSVKIK